MADNRKKEMSQLRAQLAALEASAPKEAKVDDKKKLKEAGGDQSEETGDNQNTDEDDDDNKKKLKEAGVDQSEETGDNQNTDEDDDDNKKKLKEAGVDQSEE